MGLFIPFDKFESEMESLAGTETSDLFQELTTDITEREALVNI